MHMFTLKRKIFYIVSIYYMNGFESKSIYAYCNKYALILMCVFDSQHADVLKSHPQILATISDHLFGLMEGFVNTRYCYGVCVCVCVCVYVWGINVIKLNILLYA